MKHRPFEHKARIAFWVAIGIVFVLGGWIVALIFLIGWGIMASVVIAVRAIVIYGDENWGAGLAPHEHVTPKQMNQK